MDKKFRLPKDHFIDDQDVEGHRVPPGDRATESHDEPDERDAKGTSTGTPFLQPTDDDVEGHRAPADDFTALPAPPSIGTRRGHGGE